MIKVFWASSEVALLSQEFSQAVELSMEERIWKKEKSVGWLQRSRNAFMGAADAVRRAADRSGHGAEEAKRLEALVMSPDGTVWGGLGNGLLVQWDSGGNRLKELLSIPVAVKCLLAVGTRLWVGYANGRVEVRGPVGNFFTSCPSISHRTIIHPYCDIVCKQLAALYPTLSFNSVLYVLRQANPNGQVVPVPHNCRFQLVNFLSLQLKA